MDGQQTANLNKKVDKMLSLLEQLVAVEMSKGGATQRDVAENLGISVGKVNKLVKGVKLAKDSYDKK